MSMDYARLGNSGLKVSLLTFGTALTIGTEKKTADYASELIDTAWDVGIRSFDVSNNYGDGEAESLLGRALRKYDRHEYVIATKGSWPIGPTPYDRGLSRKHILWALGQSLMRLDMDYVDIYYAHRYDPETPMEEIARTFDGIVRDGKARYWATSEWPQEALSECWETCEKLNLIKPIAEQFIYSFALRKAEGNGVMDFCKAHKVGMMGFSPLCQGILTGKYRNGIPDESRIAKAASLNYDKTKNFYYQNKAIIDGFLDICSECEVDETAVALQWCIRQGVLPVFGGSRKEQIVANAKAIDAAVPDQVWAKLEALGE